MRTRVFMRTPQWNGDDGLTASTVAPGKFQRRLVPVELLQACLLDLQILADELELALQGDLVLPPFEGHAQQVAEADQQMARSIDVFLHQDSNSVKTVEQKVRM